MTVKFFIKSLLITFCFTLSFALFSTNQVLAQEISPSPLKTDLIWQKERLDEDIYQTRQLYNQNLEKYRSEERLYNIAVDQYAALKTLAASEDLVLKTKSLALIRDQVLIDYFTLLKLNLYASEGVELSLQDQYLSILDQGIEFLKQHRAELESKNTKDDIQASLLAFQELGDPQNFSHKVLAILALARLQRIYDLAVPLRAEIEQSFIEDAGSLDALTLERAMTETDKALTTTQTNLQALWTKANSADSLASIYRNLGRDLEPVYVNLSQSLAYLKELLSF